MAGTRPVQLPVDAVDQTAARPAGAFFGTAITDVELPDSADDSTVTEMDSDSSSFAPVESRRLKRKLRRTSTAGESTTKTVDKPGVLRRTSAARELPTENVDAPDGFSVAFVATTETANLNTINRQRLTQFFDQVIPGQVQEVRINAWKNVLTVDVKSQASVDKLKEIGVLGGMPVRPYLSHGKRTSTGVITDVDPEITDSDLRTLINSTARIVDIHRFGRSRCVKVVFETDSIPSHVKVGYVRHPVRLYVPRPVQCHKCNKIGHVSAVCRNEISCRRCGGSHQHDTCTTETVKCTNCFGAHEATAKGCPMMKNERLILKKMVKDNSSHQEAAASIRRRKRRSRSRRSKSHATSLAEPPSQKLSAQVPQRLELQNKTPPAAAPHVTTVVQKDAGILSTSSDVEWPALSSKVVEPTRPRFHAVPADNVDKPEGQQVNVLLKQLVHSMRTLLSGLNTPTARVVVQFLEAIEPLLAALH